MWPGLLAVAPGGPLFSMHADSMVHFADAMRLWVRPSKISTARQDTRPGELGHGRVDQDSTVNSYCAEMASGWPFSAIMQLRTLADADELSFLARWMCFAGLKVISPAFNSKGCSWSGANRSAPSSM